MLSERATTVIRPADSSSSEADSGERTGGGAVVRIECLQDL